MSTTQSSASRQERRLKVFLCHSSGDKRAVHELYTRLKKDGFAPWLDEEDLLPGQPWQEEIPVAVRVSDVVLVCLSQQSVSKEGYLQKEIRDALSAAEEKPEGTIFIIPVRLQEVDVPRRLSQWQWANLFQKDGYERLTRALAARAAAIDMSMTVPVAKTSVPALEATEIASAPRTPSETSSRSRLPLFRGKRRALISLTCVVVVLALAYVAYLYQASKRRQEADRALQQRFEQAKQDAAAALKAVESKKALSTTPPSSSPSKSQEELRFDSRPPGAKVTVDGYPGPGWITPCSVSLIPVGPHSVVFSKQGYITETREVIVFAGKNPPVSVDLTPAASKLKVSSTPPGASIEIDGKDTGKITPDEINLEKGGHTITLHKDGYNDASNRLTLAEGESAGYSPVLLLPSMEMASYKPKWKELFGSSSIAIKPGQGVVHIRTVPSGATIEIGDKIAPHKTDVWWPVAPGIYDITLSLDGYKPVRRRVEVKEGKEYDTNETLQKQ